MAGWKILEDQSPRGWRVLPDAPETSAEPSAMQSIVNGAGWVAGKVARGAANLSPVGIAAQLAYDNPDLVEGTLRSSAKGAMLGFSDRAEAGVRAALTDDTYDQSLQKVRDEQAAFEQEHPALSTTAELAGGFAMPGGAVLKGGKAVADTTRAALRAGGASRRVANAVGTTAGSAAAGTVFGAGAGAGHTKDLTDLPQVAEDTAEGAATGAVLGPVLERTGGALWNGAKAAGRFADDAGRRVYEAMGGDASTSAVRLAANEVEGANVARLPGQTRAQARAGAADLDAQVANAATPGVGNSLAIANPRGAALAEHLGSQKWMPDQPYTDFAQRNLGDQTERVSRALSEALNGTPVDHRALMNTLETGATRAQDATYAAIRQGNIGGRGGNLRVNNLRTIVDENPAMAQHLQQAIDETVADSSVRFTRADAERVLDGDFLRTDNLHPAVVERLYANLSSATHSGDGVARGLLTQLQAQLGQTSRGRSMLGVKESHAQAFRNLEAGRAGESIWGLQGRARDDALRANAQHGTRERDVFREAAAGSAGLRVAGDQGTFTRPQNIVGSAENRSTMDELFGPNATARAQALVDREGNVHDVSTRMIEARMGANNGQPEPGVLAQALKTGVQWKFTPSVALMGAWQRVMTGITKQRGAAFADIALNQGNAGIARVRDELVRREAIRARQPDVRRRIGAISQVLGNQSGVYGGNE